MTWDEAIGLVIVVCWVALVSVVMMFVAGGVVIALHG